jgi:hypothetical protein
MVEADPETFVKRFLVRGFEGGLGTRKISPCRIVDEVQDKAAPVPPITSLVEAPHDLYQSREYTITPLPVRYPGIDVRQGEDDFDAVLRIKIEERLVPLVEENHAIASHKDTPLQGSAFPKKPGELGVQFRTAARYIDRGYGTVSHQDLQALLHDLPGHGFRPARSRFDMAVPAFQVTPVPDIHLKHVDPGRFDGFLNPFYK